MDRFLEYLTHHYYLVGATAILAVVAAAFEIRQRARGGSGVSVTEAVRLHNQGAVFLDVRPREQFDAGHIIDARNVPSTTLNESTDTLKKYRDKPVIVCCETGVSADGAARVLKAQGFNKVATLKGGLAAWRQENLPVVAEKPKKETKK